MEPCPSFTIIRPVVVAAGHHKQWPGLLMSNTIHHPLIRPSKHSLHCRTFLPPLFSTLNIPHSQSDTDIQPWQRVARQSDRLNSVLCPNQSPVGMALVSSQSLVFSHLSYVVCFWLKEYLNTSVYLKKIFFF